MNPKYQIAGIVMCLAIAFGLGRFTVPAKVITKVQAVTVEKDATQTDTNINTHKVVTKHEIDKPDGTKDITTVVTDTADDTQNSVSLKDKSSILDQSTIIVKSSHTVNFYALGAYDFSHNEPAFGAHVSTDLVGPLQVGLFGLTNGTLGCSIGLGL